MNKRHPTQRHARAFAVLALVLLAVLTLSLGLALRPATAAAQSGPSVSTDKDTETPRPSKTPDPSKTPEPTETETVEPTETVDLTGTPELTETPEPTETQTPEGTETPELTETPEPTETETPEGTETPQGTETPGSTSTPAPVAQRARFEIKGTIESKSGGVWRIGGQDVMVDGSTRIDESDGAAAVGAQAEVKGFRDEANRLLATRIKVESGNGGGGGGGGTTPSVTKWRGFIEKLPTAGLLGEWQVGGRIFTVNAQTQLPDGAAAYKVGAWVKVQAVQGSNGVLTAHEVELEND